MVAFIDRYLITIVISIATGVVASCIYTLLKNIYKGSYSWNSKYSGYWEVTIYDENNNDIRTDYGYLLHHRYSNELKGEFIRMFPDGQKMLKLQCKGVLINERIMCSFWADDGVKSGGSSYLSLTDDYTFEGRHMHQDIDKIEISRIKFQKMTDTSKIKYVKANKFVKRNKLSYFVKPDIYVIAVVCLIFILGWPFYNRGIAIDSSSDQSDILSNNEIDKVTLENTSIANFPLDSDAKFACLQIKDTDGSILANQKIFICSYDDEKYGYDYHTDNNGYIYFSEHDYYSYIHITEDRKYLIYKYNDDGSLFGIIGYAYITGVDSVIQQIGE